MSKYGVFSGPYFPVFSPITGKYGSEKISYLVTFHEVVLWRAKQNNRSKFRGEAGTTMHKICSRLTLE